MRSLAAVLVSLVLAAGLAVAALAAAHAWRGPTTTTTDVDPQQPPLPGPFVIDPAPLDRAAHEVTFGVADANHRRRFRVAATVTATEPLRAQLLALGGEDALLQRATVGADGELAFEGLRAGSYELRVRNASGRDVVPPRKLEVDRDLELDLREPRIDARFELWFDDGKAPQPLPKATLMLSRDGALLAHGRSDANGQVTLAGVPQARLEWRVWASGPEFPEAREWTGSIDVQEPQQRLELRR